MGSATNRIATGAFTGTGAALSVNVGFRPRHVKVQNSSDLGDTQEWWDSMPANSCFTTDGTDGTQTFDTTNGITATATGFDLTASGIANVSGEQMYWYAQE